MTTRNKQSSYLPDERPSTGKLLLYALQQVIVMFPATVIVALITGFQVSTTVFASGLATVCFTFITGGKIPMYYGSSFAYLTAIGSLKLGEVTFNEVMRTSGGILPPEYISIAQFGIIFSGLVSIAAGLLVRWGGKGMVEKILPAQVTGPIAMIIGLTLAGNAMSDAAPVAVAANGLKAAGDALIAQLGNLADPATVSSTLNTAMASLGDTVTSALAAVPQATVYNSNWVWVVSLSTLLATVLFSRYLKGFLGQLPLLLGAAVGCGVAGLLYAFGGPEMSLFRSIPDAALSASVWKLGDGSIFALPAFTLPTVSWAAVAAVMPIAIATIPESTAHIYQLDIYVNNEAKKRGKHYDISSLLDRNLIGDGVCDMISGAVGGPAGTNYGENISTMAITKVFSVPVMFAAGILAMVISCFTPFIKVIFGIPQAVIGGLEIYLFGAIAAQGIAILIEKGVSMFDSKNIAVIAVIMTFGLGVNYFFGGNINFFGINVPAIAGAAVLGIVLNFLLSFGDKKVAKADA